MSTKTAKSPDSVVTHMPDDNNNTGGADNKTHVVPVQLDSLLERETTTTTAAVEFRKHVMIQAGHAGNLCRLFAEQQPQDKATPIMAALLLALMKTSRTLGINLASAVRDGTYCCTTSDDSDWFSVFGTQDLPRVLEQIRREGEHSAGMQPQTIVLTLMAKMGTLAEEAQLHGSGEAAPRNTIAQILAEVTSCLLRLAVVLEIDLVAELKKLMDESPVVKYKIPLQEFRNCILVQGGHVGVLCSRLAHDTPAATHTTMGCLLKQVMDTSRTVGINLALACHAKIDLNCKKYPIKSCKGKSDKYTHFSQQTGITKSIGQDIGEECFTNDHEAWYPTFCTKDLPVLSHRALQFCIDRDFLQFHTPRSIALALAGEQGELAELVQFHGDDDTSPKAWVTMEERKEIAKEIADVAIYLFRLAQSSGVDLVAELEKQLKA